MASAKYRLIQLLAAGLGAGLLVSCSAPGQESPSGAEYPPAPEQLQPPADPQYVDGSDVPAGEPIAAVSIAELAEPGWVQDTAESTGIPPRALRSYAGAALRARQTHPGCGIGWNTLAGIGQVESHHGHYGGSQIDSDGVVSPPIIGVALDGGPGVMEIPDTDDGELDGDSEYDRAVGPMQFIPGTWQLYAQDGSRSGDRNPQQYDDAAMTAAAYLCQRGTELDSDEGWVRAVLAYNQSAQYARDVAGHAEGYAAAAADNG